MNFYIIIPAHNEEDSIAIALDSLINQTLLPKKVVVVNDNSTDNTQSIVDTYVKQYDWLDMITITSSNKHIPGYKVVNAFYKGFETLDENYDILCKFDADILLPHDYLERIKLLFESNTRVGIAGGLAYIKKDNTWIYENISDKNHVRGPIKAYRKLCFKEIGGLKPSIGWDTLDTLLAKFHGWTVNVDRDLHVKHLKPTGLTYTKNTKYLQGEALYKMRYRLFLTLITALKMASKKQSIIVFGNYMKGYFKAKRSKMDYLVTQDEGQFIRSLRWKGIWNKLT